MRRFGYAVLFAAIALGVSGVLSIANAGGHSIGAGLHYLRNLRDVVDIKPAVLNGSFGDEWDNNSFSIMGSYRYSTSLLKVEGDLEYVFDFAGSGEAMWIPSAWLLAGGMIYGGAGVGIGYINDEWQDDPFYALRAGVNLALASLNLDVFGTYQFQNGGQFGDLTVEDLNSVTFAALLRFDIGGK